MICTKVPGKTVDIVSEAPVKNVLLWGSRFAGSGVKEAGSMALGMTNTRSAAIPARSTVFSLATFETQMKLRTTFRLITNDLFDKIEERSAKPKSEWSVKTVWIPIWVA